MTHMRFEFLLQELLESEAAAEQGLFEVKSVWSFDEVGVLGYNRGLVVSLGDGSEFQLAILGSGKPKGAR